jgi:hypothetical protein
MAPVIALGQVTRAVRTHTLDHAPLDRHDLRAPDLEREEPVVHPRGMPAEQCARAAGLHRGQPAAPRRQTEVADGVDAAVDAMQVTPRHASRDPVLVETTGQQLIEGEHAVCVSCAPSHECVSLIAV